MISPVYIFYLFQANSCCVIQICILGRKRKFLLGKKPVKREKKCPQYFGMLVKQGKHIFVKKQTHNQDQLLYFIGSWSIILSLFLLFVFFSTISINLKYPSVCVSIITTTVGYNRQWSVSNYVMLSVCPIKLKLLWTKESSVFEKKNRKTFNLQNPLYVHIPTVIRNTLKGKRKRIQKKVNFYQQSKCFCTFCKFL